MAFDQKIADAVCERLVNGESLRTICTDEKMPAASTIFRWLADDANQAFREQYTRAREAQADTMADEILDIADDASNDWMERLGDDEKPAGWQLNGEHVQRSKLRIEARKWLAAKLQPKKYGDAQLLKLGDADGNKIDLASVIATRRQQAAEGRGGGET